jgi:hypothetical protein
MATASDPQSSLAHRCHTPSTARAFHAIPVASGHCVQRWCERRFLHQSLAGIRMMPMEFALDWEGYRFLRPYSAVLRVFFTGKFKSLHLVYQVTGDGGQVQFLQTAFRPKGMLSFTPRT